MLILDKCNTHTPAASYATLPPAEAKQLVEKIEWRCSHKHGSRVNRAEIERRTLRHQCLDRRLPDIAGLETEGAAWVERRTTTGTGMNQRCTTADARVKLKRLHPSLQG